MHDNMRYVYVEVRRGRAALSVLLYFLLTRKKKKAEEDTKK